MSALERGAGWWRVIGEEIFEVVIEYWRGPGTGVQRLRGESVAMWEDGGIVLGIFAEVDLRAEACGCLAHGDGCFAHAVEGVTAGFCWGTLLD